MGKLSEAVKPEPVQRECRAVSAVVKALQKDGLDAADRSLLETMLDDHDVSMRSIEVGMHAIGVPVSRDSITKHRKGLCSCG